MSRVLQPRLDGHQVFLRLVHFVSQNQLRAAAGRPHPSDAPDTQEAAWIINLVRVD